MEKYIINGGRKLNGEIEISGSKNSSLPIIAACVLNAGVCKLYNVPKIHDTDKMFEILEKLGCKIKKNKNVIIVDSKNITNYEIPDDLMRQMRSSVILAGALLARFNKAIFTYPGGCDIGSRPIDLHLKSFQKIGINISENYGKINCICDKIIATNVDLDFPSVGATENAILASVFTDGVTTITNAAQEPEIVDLQEFLNRMGAKVQGAGTNNIQITGVQKLKDVSYNIMPDRIEAGTFLCAAAITKGNIRINNVNPNHLTAVLAKLAETGCKLNIDKNWIEIMAPKRLKAVNIKTMPYSGFPTDLQSIFSTILTTAKGTSYILENIFENRFKYTQELVRMGAEIQIEGRMAIIKGKKHLKANVVKVPDLRGGAALILAGLNAKGTTIVEEPKYVLRGYEKIEEKLTNLGAQIELV